MTTTEHASVTAGARRAPGSALVPAVTGLLVLLLLTAFASLMFGATDLMPGETLRALSSKLGEVPRLFAGDTVRYSGDRVWTVVWQIRLPRAVDAILVGASLGLAGALLQGVTRNPLADPAILGLVAAAGLGSTVVITIDNQVSQWGIALASVGGAFVGGFVLFFIAWRGAISPVRLALAGVAISAFFGAAIVGLLASSRTFLQTNLGFLAGGLYLSEWRDMRAMLPFTVVGGVAGILLSGRLNVLALGDDVAASLGLHADRTRAAVIATAAALTGAAVATAGLVGFVGLVSPHLARTVAGQDSRAVLPVSALVGAVLVMAADLGARLVIQPSEIPMGIITAAIGAPFLLYAVKFRP